MSLYAGGQGVVPWPARRTKTMTAFTLNSSGLAQVQYEGHDVVEQDRISFDLRDRFNREIGYRFSIARTTVRPRREDERSYYTQKLELAQRGTLYRLSATVTRNGL